MSPSSSSAPGSSLVSAFGATVARRRDQPALRSSDRRIDLSWHEYEAAADGVAAGLAAQGAGPGDAVAMLMGNRPEWQLTDTGALIAGATPFSLYPSAPVEQSMDLLRRSGAKVLVADAALLDGVVPPPGLAVVEVDGSGRLGMTFEQLQQAGRPATSRRGCWLRTSRRSSARRGRPGPRRASSSHTRRSCSWSTCSTRSTRSTGGRTISYLPHAHVVDRIVGHYLSIAGGSTVTTVDRPMSVFSELPSIRPTLFTSPALIEQTIVDASPLVSSAVVVGDARAFDVALIVLDLAEVAARLGVSGEPQAVVADPVVSTAIAAAVDAANERLSRAERIRRHVVLPRTRSAEAGEVTPTLKTRRSVVEVHDADDIERMYRATGTPPVASR